MREAIQHTAFEPELVGLWEQLKSTVGDSESGIGRAIVGLENVSHPALLCSHTVTNYHYHSQSHTHNCNLTLLLTCCCMPPVK